MTRGDTRMTSKAGPNGNGNLPQLDGWFMPEPLNPRVLRRVLTLRAWRERNAVIGALTEISGGVEGSSGLSG